MKANAKILAIAVVAMFCATAYLAIADHNDSSDAQNTQDYLVYVDVISDDGKSVVGGQWIHFKSEPNINAYVNNINQAFKDYDINMKAVKDNYVFFVYGDNNQNFATYVAQDSAWTLVTDTVKQYTSCTTQLIIQNGWIDLDNYNALSDQEKQKWTTDQYGQTRKPIDVKVSDAPAPTTVKFFIEILNSSHKVDKSAWFTLNTYKNAEIFIVDFNKAMKDKDGFGDVCAYGDDSFLEFAYKENSNSACWTTDGKSSEWKFSGGTGAEYYGVSQFAICLNDGWISPDEYNKLPADQQSQWKTSQEMGGWYAKYPSQWNPAKKSNTILYVAIAIVAILVILALAYYFLVAKKKGAAA